MTTRKPIVIGSNNKLRRLEDEDSLEGTGPSGDTLQADLFLGDATVPTSAGDWDELLEFDDNVVSSVSIRQIALTAPPTLQTGPGGITTVQISTDPDFILNQQQISLSDVDTSKVLESSIEVDVSSGEKLYVRFAAVGGHASVRLKVIYEAS